MWIYRRRWTHIQPVNVQIVSAVFPLATEKSITNNQCSVTGESNVSNDSRLTSQQSVHKCIYMSRRCQCIRHPKSMCIHKSTTDRDNQCIQSVYLYPRRQKNCIHHTCYTMQPANSYNMITMADISNYLLACYAQIINYINGPKPSPGQFWLSPIR